ncbi:MAG: N-sulfoglucosamine sulfohydrolase, partial [Mariniblastus sp.]
KDSDGDGLSDEWENFNDRNPTDGKLEFQFNCGGWQTEGWTGDNNVTNIAGKQGQLEFEMLNPKASLKRKGLNLSPDKNTNGLAILLKCSQPITMEFMVNGQSLMILDLPTTEEFTEYDLHDGSLGKKAINRLELVFESPAGTVIEIDKIEAK